MPRPDPSTEAGSSDVDETRRLEEPALHPLETAAAALDSPARRSRRPSRKADRARRRAEKRSARAERKAHVREQERDSAPTDALVARLPAINPLLAAVISGALAGLATVLLAIGAAKGCESVRDNSSCGGGLGLLALVAILAIEVLIGANLLKAWQIPDPFSTSFLGIGVVATIAMLTFLDDLDSVWMLLVIPLMTAAAFALSWWITVRFIDEHPMSSEVDSERGEPDFDEDAGPVPSQDEARDEDSNA